MQRLCNVQLCHYNIINTNSTLACIHANISTVHLHYKRHHCDRSTHVAMHLYAGQVRSCDLTTAFTPKPPGRSTPLHSCDSLTTSIAVLLREISKPKPIQGCSTEASHKLTTAPFAQQQQYTPTPPIPNALAMASKSPRHRITPYLFNVANAAILTTPSHSPALHPHVRHAIIH